MLKDIGILVDFDGTLIDSEEMHKHAITSWMTGHGWDVERYAKIFLGRRAIDVMTHEPGPWTGMDYEALVAEVYGMLDINDIQPVPGAPEFLLWIKEQNIPVALVTSGTENWVATGIAAAELPITLDYFDELMTAERQPKGKPAPDGYLAAMKALDRAPQYCAIFEDSPVGVTAAVAANAGLVTGLTTSQPGETLLELGAHLLYPDLTKAIGQVTAWADRLN